MAGTRVGKAVLEFRTDTGTVFVDVKQMKSAIADLGKQSRDTGKDTSGLSSSFGDLGKSVLTTAAGFFTAQAAMSAVRGTIRAIGGEIETLVMHGSAVADVSDNFDRLTKQANLSGAALMGSLRQGTHNTIADFELMKIVNEQLGAGLRLTDKDMGTLAKGAFALAQATGGDVKTALETMSDAMLTGRTRSLALLTGKINETKAEEDYARKLGVTKDELTEAGKIEAHRVAIIRAVIAVLSRLGVQTDGLDERVAQLQTRWTNFNDELGRTVGNSPVLNAAFSAIEDAVSKALGVNQEGLVKALGHQIDQLAISLVSAAQTGISAFGILITEAIALYKIVGDLTQLAYGLAISFEVVSLALAKAVNFSTFGKAMSDDITRIRGNIHALEQSVLERGAALQSADKAQSAVADGSTRLNAVLDQVRARMIAANTATNANADASKNAGAAAKGAAAGLGTQRDALVDTTKASEEFAKKLREFTADVRRGLKSLNDQDFEKEFGTKLADMGRDMAKFGITGARVPAAVRQAFERLNQIDLAKFAEQMKNVPNFIEANMVGGASGERAKLAEATDMAIGESAKRRSETLRDVAHTEAEIDFQRAEAGIKSAERWGASWQQVYAMEAQLSKARLDLQVSESRQAFEDRVRALKATSFVSDNEYNAMLTDQEAKERLMVESWRLSEQAKRDEIAITHNIWLRTWMNMREAAQEGVHALSDSIAGLLLSPQRVTAETKLAAEQARKSYDDVKKSGTATPLEIQAAFERMRKAEDDANVGFGHRFVGVWESIKRSITKILDDILDHFITGFLKGVLNSLTKTSLGQKAGGWLGGLLGGGSGGGGGFGSGGNVAMSAAGKVLPKLFGGGAAAATAMTVDTLPGALAATTASVDTLAGAGAVGGTAAAGGGIGASLGAFLSNPWTIGIGAALVTGLILAKKFGKDKVNKPRDQFSLQFGKPGDSVADAQGRLAAQLTSWTGEPGGGHLFAAMQSARKDLNAFHSAEDGIIAEFARHGVKNIKKYSNGGFIMPGLVQPAILHGGSRGELVLPMDRFERLFRAIGTGSRQVIVQAPMIVQGMLDGELARKFHAEHTRRYAKEDLFFNADGFATAVAGAR